MEQLTVCDVSPHKVVTVRKAAEIASTLRDFGDQKASRPTLLGVLQIEDEIKRLVILLDLVFKRVVELDHVDGGIDDMTITPVDEDRAKAVRRARVNAVDFSLAEGTKSFIRSLLP